MKVLIFHGYLLRGTGSNVYNASLATALARLGHEVHLVCQERDPPAFPSEPGSVTVHLPRIGRLLPVFVSDRYEGFEAKTFRELDDAELERYLSANVAAVREVAETVGGIDAALANHLVMGPVILRRAGLRYALKVHGSDLSYTVLPELERFRPYASEAVAGANGILVGSAHIAERLALAVARSELDGKVRLGPPGVDTELFEPVAAGARASRLRKLAAELRIGAGAGVHDGEPPSAWDRDVGRAGDAVDWLADAPGPRVVFVGKLIVSKGADLLLAAWPLVHRSHPGARLLVVGFGAYERGLRRLWAALAGGDLDRARQLARRGRAEEGGEQAALRMLSAFLAEPPVGYAEAAASAAGSVELAGRLEHGELARLLPSCDALVFPSTFPEAFGMVAAEAAAAGVLPISADHSGAAEVSRELAAELPAAAAKLVAFPLDDGAVGAIAARLEGWLGLPERERERARDALRATAERLWSWEKVALGVLDAAAGRLDRLPPPPSA